MAQSLLISLSGSFQTQPTFWLNPQNGVSYNVVTQAPQYDVQSLQDLRNLPLTSQQPGTPEILNDVTSISRGDRHGRGEPLRYPAHHRYLSARWMAAIWASVGAEVERIVDANRKQPAARLARC